MESQKNPTKTEQAMQLAEKFGIYFCDQFNQPHVLVGSKDHDKVISLNSREFKSFLATKFYAVVGSPANSSIISAVILTLTGQTQHNGQTFNLETRAAWHNKKIYFDLSNQKWDVVEISKDGWQITKSPLPLFKRYGHQQAQVLPAKKPIDLGALLDLFQIANDDKLLLHIWVISCFIPDIAHPVLILNGPQGSTKSTFFKFVRRLVDPSAMELISFPSDKKELIQNLAHHYFAPFDNVAYLNQDQSDVLCKACTGEGSSKRQLFTDDDDIIYSYKRVLGLNGINNAATKPDLLDRSILISFKRISKSARRADDEINFWFEGLRPGFLTHIFDTLCSAIEIRENLRLEEKPRMADFALWGESISLALGKRKNEFLQAYFRNIDLQVFEALEGSPIGEAIMALMESNAIWQGTPSELLSELELVAEQKKIRTFTKAWPKAPNTLSRRLNELKTTLADMGLFVQDSHDGKKRTISIHKNIVSDVSIVKQAENQPKLTEFSNDSNDTNGISKNIELHEPVLSDSVGVQCTVCSQRSHEGAYKNELWHCSTCLKAVVSGV